jgi:hypothetical protein
MDLRTRAQNFLDLPIPRGIDYVPDSIAEMFIRNYVVGGDFDNELTELGEMALISVDEIIDEGLTPDAEEYFHECKEIIAAILKELGLE